MKQDQSSKQFHKVVQTPLREIVPSDISQYPEQRGGKNKAVHPHDSPEQDVRESLSGEKDVPSGSTSQTETHIRFSLEHHNKKFAIVAYGVIAIIIIVATIILYHLVQKPIVGESASSLFVKAEKLYEVQKYNQALVLYLQFLRENPHHSLVPLVKERLQKINLQEIERRNSDKLAIVNNLLKKAREAFSRQRYVIPENDNVVDYTEEILRIIPDHPDALELRQSLIQHYQEQAQTAFRRREYQKAAQYYETILKINMEDKETENKLYETLKLIEGTSQLSRSLDIDKNTVVKLKNQAKTFKEEALLVDADETSAFSQALKKEAAAESKLNQQEYVEAYALFEQAVKLFEKAIELRNRQLENQTELAMNRMIGAKAEAERVQAQYHVPEIFRKADLKAAEARELFRRKQYLDAIKAFEEAQKIYLTATTAARSAS